MPSYKNISAGLVVSFLSISLAACGTTSKSIQNYNPSVSLQGLTQDRSAEPTLVYTRSGAPDLGNYESFIIDPVRVSYRDGSIKGLDREQVGKMRRKLQAELIAELVSSGYEVTKRPGSRTMRVSMTIANLKAPSAALNVTNVVLPLPFSLSVGEVTVEAIFRQSAKNRIDAVVVNRAQGQRLMNAKPWSTWSDAEQSFKEWAKGIRKAVDKAHGK